MLTEFKMPELGENVSAGTIARILVNIGDAIAVGQNVLEVETDKAVAEIPSTVAGVVREIRVKEGQKVNTGAVLFTLDSDSAARPAAAAKEEQPVPAQPAAPTAAPAAPKEAPAPATAPKSPAPAAVPSVAQGKVRAAPSTRQFALNNDVDLSLVPSGDGSGRVTTQDVKNYIALRDSGTPSAPAAAAEKEAPAPVSASITAGESGVDTWGAVEVLPLSTLKTKAAVHLTSCWQTIPHVTHFDKADITELEAFRQASARKAEARGVRLTITAFLIKALPEVLKRFPTFNASIDMDNLQLSLKKYYNIGVAVDTENGLLVPNIRSVDQKNVTDISVEMAELAKKARDRKLTLEEMRGATFTVSNLGGLGGYAFTPIINAPEVAILGVSRSVVEPVYLDGEFQPRLMLPLSLSYDHRAIDGADAARFLRFLCDALAQPWQLLLGA
ncbi:MAG TPA: 2-oxo acid dehydrogenase subunit E2 [Candidatus Hydrogenedentes bacterium]|jgi:pyruvate dehydrogenase E2 component (dihydrolipoamide acetyltransferase)|nr:MAG: Dihydrolipoyllysine-residue acetyltransferase component of pyruvate dehydrogenase complex [Candidatus Hydrogenedentes bacterium ADurb.Bin170]HNZ48979.1 2-oxo acid dehydrogenase subunit E2 [Candidatus Hydrogenedentota bacterium]HOH41477.1 2-oxo acid dehydrogenase subunit E2 [Candidatus Hydrogenedentota bacterium]HPX87414.1 2-oxo acid dehydrogenase subunit E2 [Candidatus Hydrogenedentota bacterium]HQB03224.1 2-oxo acid dehydrogenase subunit E2 [Candidatus Hydrogenedentota bacterium]